MTFVFSVSSKPPWYERMSIPRAAKVSANTTRMSMVMTYMIIRSALDNDWILAAQSAAACRKKSASEMWLDKFSISYLSICFKSIVRFCRRNVPDFWAKCWISKNCELSTQSGFQASDFRRRHCPCKRKGLVDSFWCGEDFYQSGQLREWKLVEFGLPFSSHCCQKLSRSNWMWAIIHVPEILQYQMNFINNNTKNIV